MKNYTFLNIFLLAAHFITAQTTIPIEASNQAIVLQTDAEGHLLMVYCGKPLARKEEYASVYGNYHMKDEDVMGLFNSAYPFAGTLCPIEPAIQAMHGDGNGALDLKYVKHETKALDAHSSLTTILLRDPVYPFEVTLFYKVWKAENVIEQWSEIRHSESKAVVLKKFASANLYLTDKDFYLTTFHGSWASEMQPDETKLSPGMFAVDSKLGTRAELLQSHDFMVAFGQPATENDGEVMLGQLEWSGSFKLEFNVDTYHNLRLMGGVNPYASEYALAPGEVFKTPALLYTFSHHGKGEASRNLHNWARDYRLLDGRGERLTLLNNWEATFFNFNEEKLTALFKDAHTLGVDMFLLDDGWFGNKYPRNDDHAGLGDWQENVQKLPHGLGYLVKAAQKENVKFGVWIEPEMVNPKSELYEKHTDWVIRDPQRPDHYFRNQLVLDLSNPKVQDFVFKIVDSLFIKYPDLAFIKWDCNSPILNAYSAYLNTQKKPQTHLLIEYVRGLYNVLQRVRAKYPKTPMMLCSGGGGRTDYELLRYFTEFWPSDDTNPLERIYMQWNYSLFFPSIAVDNHVTDWGKQPIKYRVDVASMGKLGFDIVAGKLSAPDFAFCQQAIQNYNSFKDVVWHGDLYRLVDPFKNTQASLMYVDKNKSRAVMFSYLVSNRFMINPRENPVRLAGLDAAKTYRVKELNLYPGAKPSMDESKTYSGDFLMTVGINPELTQERMSIVLEITDVK